MVVKLICRQEVIRIVMLVVFGQPVDTLPQLLGPFRGVQTPELPAVLASDGLSNLQGDC